VNEAVGVFASGVPSPLKSQLHSVTSASSSLVLVKVHDTLMMQGGTAKFAIGAVLSGGPPPSLQAEASTSVPVTTASRPIDRIESSQPRSDKVPREPTGCDARDLAHANDRRLRQSRANRRRSAASAGSAAQLLILNEHSLPIGEVSQPCGRPTTVATGSAKLTRPASRPSSTSGAEPLRASLSSGFDLPCCGVVT
jgi:hypothetical protein